MRFEDQRQKINIYINRRDRFQGKPLYRAIVETMYKHEVSGISVFQSVVSYGSQFRIHGGEFAFLRNRGIMIQIIETEKKSKEILKLLDDMIPNGIITTETINMIRYTKAETTEEDQELASDSAATSIGQPYDIDPDN